MTVADSLKKIEAAVETELTAAEKFIQDCGSESATLAALVAKVLAMEEAIKSL